MRRWWAIVRATALEIASEPLALLLTLSALGLAVLTPAMHYHQFGEASRMARDAGLSALLVGGLAFAVFCTIKSVRREIESGTLQMALAHPVSRTAFFLSKLAGAAIAYLGFAVTVSAASLTTVNGAAIGGEIAAKTGDIAVLYRPSLAVAVAAIVLPPVVGALLNRFGRFRFALTATVTALVTASLGICFRFDATLAARFLPVALALVFPGLVFIAAAGAFAVRFRDNASASLAGLLFAVSLPALGSYYLSDALSKGAPAPWGFISLAAAASLPFVAGFALLGVHLFKGRDIA